MPNNLAHPDSLGAAPHVHVHPDGQGGLSNDALAEAILSQLGELGSGLVLVWSTEIAIFY
jgi:hypothetical protein